MKTDFGSPDAEHALGGRLSRTLEPGRLAVGRVYDVPSDDTVAKYRNDAYPDWLSACEQTLPILHHLLQQREPINRFCFSVVNNGTRPAAGALVTIEARGKFRTMAARDSNDSEPIRLPAPPAPPRGRWRNPFQFDYDFRRAMDPSLFGQKSLVDALQPASPRDPNEFFHKSDNPPCPGGLVQPELRTVAPRGRSKGLLRRGLRSPGIRGCRGSANTANPSPRISRNRQ